MDVKDAVRTARQYLMDLYAEEQAQGFRLEEVEFCEFALPARWLVTISFFLDKPVAGDPSFAAFREFDRIYKQVAIREPDGVALSMKIRDLASSAG